MLAADIIFCVLDANIVETQIITVMQVQNPELEKLFLKICKSKPPKSCLKKLGEYQNQHAVREFLIGKLNELLAMSEVAEEWDNDFEWGVIHSCYLLAELQAEEAGEVLVELLDLVKDDHDAALYDAIMFGLEGIGQTALESAYKKYKRDSEDSGRASTWIWVLANLGVKDERIRQVLIDHMLVDSDEAVHLMGGYGDQSLFPIVESYVQNTANYLNQHKIDPFTGGARFENELVASYINNRESLVMLRDNIPVDHTDFDRRVEELDRQLLKYADFGIYDDSVIADRQFGRNKKVGRNSPCPCGSRKKFKNCCGKK